MHCNDDHLYDQIATKLMAKIVAGDYKPGDRLPSENELATQYGVHRLTARRAITALVEKDLVYRLQGRGAFVKEAKLDYALNHKTSFTQSLFSLGFLPCIKVLGSQIMPAGQQLAELLNISVGIPVIQVKILRSATPPIVDATIPELKPLCVSLSYLVSENFPELPVLIYRAHSLYSLLKEHYGVELHRTRTLIEAESASTEDARLLQISPKGPVLVTRSQACNQNDQVVEYTVSRFRSDRFTLEVSSQW
ncbi:MAG: phosphonate metabolism transcriptional regulator PhnF [Stenomitos rutilans HA7619-LM2]|nr:phosphonate metabolism transcriptional regulator PhnF [Stenomitos rutilans HA7619-LM2]